MPRCGQYAPAGQSTQESAFFAPPAGASAMYVPLAHVNGHMYWPWSVLYDPASHGMQADDEFCPVFALTVPLGHLWRFPFKHQSPRPHSVMLLPSQKCP